MKYKLKAIRKANFLDLKEINNNQKESSCEIEGVKLLSDIVDYEIEDTRLYTELMKLRQSEVKSVMCYMLTGREISYYYKNGKPANIKEYLEYFAENTPITKKHDMIMYICEKSNRLNNYLDAVIGRL